MGLEIENVTKVYDKKVLNGVNCKLTRGVYGLLGPNGAGKSTLIRAICGIELPTSGRILYHGKSVTVLGEAYRDILGYVPQEVGFYPDFTAGDFLRYIAVMKGLKKLEIESRIDEVLRLVNLKGAGKKKIKNFSGGMKQRLGIAQAILNHPEILILDEPTVGLDIEERMRFKQFVSEYASDRIVFFATHIVSDIADIGNEILILKDGVIKAQAAPEQLLAAVRGKIWDCECDRSEAEILKKRYRVSNAKVKGERVELRLIAGKKPAENAVLVEGSLQDLYLFLFEASGEEGKYAAV